MTEHVKAAGTIGGSRAASDELLRDAIKASSDAVEALVHLGRRYEFDLPVESLHVLEMGEQIACLTLEALRSWPGPDRPPK